MINHARTLLMNVSGATNPGIDFPGEQYVPADFVPLVMPSALETGRRILFGALPDRCLLNWRLQELLTCIHACELDNYLQDLDGRSTYWPFNSSLLDQHLASPTAVQVSGADQLLHFVGNRRGAPLDDRIYLQWSLTVLNATAVSITSTDSRGNSRITAAAYTTSGGLSSAVALPGSPLAVQFSDVINTRWNLTWLARPKRSILDVCNEAETRLHGDLRSRVFPIELGEPYQTFNNLWYDHDQWPYRLAGLTLSLAYRINESRG